MADPLNWSEHGNYDACVTISALTGLVYGGFTAFPLGIYSIAEGQALEATIAPRVGDYATLIPAVQSRYGKTIRALSTGSIADAVTRPGVGLVLAGWGCIPGTAWQQAGFAQYHSVFVVPKPPGKVLLFDPMTPNMSPGQLIDASIIVAWAKGAGVNDAREIRENEFGGDDMTIAIVRYPAPRTWRTRAGTLTGRRLDPAPLMVSSAFGAGSPAHASAEYAIDPAPAGWEAGPYQLVTDGFFAGYLIPNAAVDLDPVPRAFTQADVDAAAAKAVQDAIAALPPPEPAPASAPALPAPTDVATAKAVLVAAGIDIDKAKAELVLQTSDLNDLARARTRTVTRKNNARAFLTEG